MKLENYAFCESCSKKSFSTKEGILCGITDKKPNFSDNCDSFELDSQVHNYAYNSLVNNTMSIGIKTRVLNYLVDYVFVIFIMYLISPALIVSLKISLYWFLGIIHAVNLVYYFMAEYYYQKTIGKLLTKSKVVDAKTYNKPSLGQILIRCVFRLPFINTIDALFFMGGYNLHDKISRTKVIRSDEINIRKSQILIGLEKKS